MLLRNLHTIENVETDIRIHDRKIIETGTSLNNSTKEQEIHFENAIAFPGLINSHDHLDFNLFPQLGNRHYKNYIEWGDDIHRNNKEIIHKVLKVPINLRIKWGIYKNLLNGVTTVINHGPLIKERSDLITVFESSINLHSVQLQENWKLKLNKPLLQKLPFVIHVGEGIDKKSHNEIDRFIKWNLFNRDTIGVHGIAMSENQAKQFKALVWCPASNFFLIGESSQINKIKHATNMLFGTDSTLSAPWNLWEHLRIARNTHDATDRELFDMLTLNPAKTWQLKGCGKLEKEEDADIVVARIENAAEIFDSFYKLNPEDILMVISKGNIRLFDNELLAQLESVQFPMENFHKIIIKGFTKYIFGDLPGIMDEIRSYCPEVNFPIENER